MATQKKNDLKDYDAGFSVMEILVALVILSSALIPLIQIQINLQQSAIRLEQMNTRNDAISTGLKYIRLVNPGKNPTGKKYLGLGSLSWNSELVTEKSFFPQTRGTELRTISLYKMSIQIDIEDEIVLARDIYQVGWTEFTDLSINGL